MSDHELHLGDCLAGMAGMADKSVDVTITDPPFSAHVHAMLGKEQAVGRESRDALTFDAIDPAVAAAVAREVCRVTKRWALFFCDDRVLHLWIAAVESYGWAFVRGGIWIKPDAMPQMSGDRPSTGAEHIVIAHAPKRGRMRWNGGGRPAVWNCGIERKDRVHPTQKPLDLMEALVSDFTDPGEVILDPFAGSGTTLVACKRLGRSAIGWERDPAFHAAAVRRIDAAREQLSFPQGKRTKPKQSALALGKTP